MKYLQRITVTTKHILSLVGIIILGVTLHTVAQPLNNSITGIAVEKSSKMSLKSANVKIFDATDRTQVTGVATDMDGVFRFTNLPNDEYERKQVNITLYTRQEDNLHSGN